MLKKVLFLLGCILVIAIAWWAFKLIGKLVFFAVLAIGAYLLWTKVIKPSSGG
ncbi:hypothetical protein O5O45_20560 [Hahella aquimaris]|uniref:hypothetical protein n=1 Tax=Hahella sp. HNIBRBA332 TaxID=3015983 RepID=UPI00273C9B1F|nr:hypothetical protein [Hahella sp. HNIBRBA332]WLQ12120.1 hypothetical protein O5O45_20560 [Hahella sp. HNIBRBA332]